MNDSPHDSSIILAEHFQNNSASLFVDFPFFLNELIERSFEGILAACEFGPAGGALVLLLFDDVS